LLNKRNCEDFKALLVRYVDNQVSPEEKAEMERHLAECEDCRADLNHLQNWKGVSRDMKNKLLPDMAWDEYWHHLYNRMERGISWILISIGAIIFLAIAVYHFIGGVLTSAQISPLEKVGVFALALGFIVLLVSVLREKLMTRKQDKYKEIQR